MNYMLILADISGDTWSEDIVPHRKTLGRSEAVEIRLDHTSVSRQHCAFWSDEQACWVEDCGSTNGTYVNGIRVTKERIKPGDTISVGRFELIVEEKNHVQATLDLPESPTGFSKFSDQQQEDRRLAAIIHQRLTPSRRLTLPGMTAEVMYQPSGILGGDCFDCFELDNRWILALFDPMTHGVKAAMNSMLLRAELKRWVTLTAQPARCLEWINSELTLMEVHDLYVTSTVAAWFPRTHTLVYSSAGEHPPLVFRDGAAINMGESAGGLPLGVAPGEHYTEHLLQLKPEDRVFFFTDGISEIVNLGRVETSVNAELARRLAATAQLPLVEQMQSIMNARDNSIIDDVLLLGCEITPT